MGTIATSHLFEQVGTYAVLQFDHQKNVLNMEGNPFVKDEEELNAVLRKVRQHLVHGKNLNVFIKLTELNTKGKDFLVQLGELINKFNSRRPLVTWAPQSQDESLREGIQLLSLHPRQIRVV